VVAVLDELCGEAGQSWTRFIAQLVTNAQIRRDIERDAEWYRQNGPTELAQAVARHGTQSLPGVWAVDGGAHVDSGEPDGSSDSPLGAARHT